MHVWVKPTCSRKSIVKSLGAPKVQLMGQYFGKSYICVLGRHIEALELTRSMHGAKIPIQCSELCRFVWWMAGFVGFSDFRIFDVWCKLWALFVPYFRVSVALRALSVLVAEHPH